MENETGTYCLCGEPFSRVEIAHHSTLCTRCLWRKAEIITRAEMYDTVGYVSRLIIEELHEKPDMYVQDSISEHADNWVTVYRGELVRQWYAVDMPSPDDYGLESVGTSEDMTTGLYGWYVQAITERVESLTGVTVSGDVSF